MPVFVSLLIGVSMATNCLLVWLFVYFTGIAYQNYNILKIEHQNLINKFFVFSQKDINSTSQSFLRVFFSCSSSLRFLPFFFFFFVFFFLTYQWLVSAKNIKLKGAPIQRFIQTYMYSQILMKTDEWCSTTKKSNQFHNLCHCACFSLVDEFRYVRYPLYMSDSRQISGALK